MILMNGLNNLKRNNMNNNLEFENEDPSPDSIEDDHPRTNYGQGYYEEPKQETLEEIRKYAELSYYNGDEINAFVNGAKWQQKRMYSDEEAFEFFIEGYRQRAIASNLIFDNASRMYAISLFEQFKKK